MARWLNRGKLSRLDLLTHISIWQNFAMTFLETLNTKVADNDLSFPLVTHMAFSDARFGSYGILNSVRVLKTFWTDCADRRTIRFLGPKMQKT
jgi:hypothetical protein